MKFQVQAEVFRNGLNKILTVVDRKNPRPILTYTLINIVEDGVQFCSTDLEISARVNIKGNVQNTGSFCVNGKNLFDIVRELPNENILFEVNDNSLNINCGDIHYSLLIIKSDDYPFINFMHKDNLFTLSSEKVQNIISKTLHAISTDETRLFLNGMFMQISDHKLRTVAIDGYKLALLDNEFDNLEIGPLIDGIIIPRKGIIELKRMAENFLGSDIQFSVDDTFIYASVNDEYFLSMRLISREYIKYQSVIPSSTNYTLRVDKKALLDSVKRIKIMSNEKSQGLKVKMSESEIIVMANHPSLGDARETIPAEYMGPDLEYGFNANYLVDVLSTFGESNIMIEGNNSLSPVLIKSETEQDFLSIIMPLKLQY